MNWTKLIQLILSWTSLSPEQISQALVVYKKNGFVIKHVCSASQVDEIKALLVDTECANWEVKPTQNLMIRGMSYGACTTVQSPFLKSADDAVIALEKMMKNS